MTLELEQIKMRSHGKKSRRRVQRLIIAGVLLFLFISCLGRVWQVWQVRRELATLESEIENATMINDQLREQKEMLESLDYVERVARDELGLVKPGEITYLTIRYRGMHP